MKKIKKLGTGGLPAGSPERGGGFSSPTGPRFPRPISTGPSGPRPISTEPSGPRPIPKPYTGPSGPRPISTEPRGSILTGPRGPKPYTGPNIPRPATPMPSRGAAPAPASAGGGRRMMKKGGKVSSVSSRADGCAVKGKTKGRFV